jgi:hypothetical protein
VAPANNLLAEISKASSGTVCHIAGKWFLHSYTAAHELVCKCKAGSLPIAQQIVRFTNPLRVPLAGEFISSTPSRARCWTLQRRAKSSGNFAIFRRDPPRLALLSNFAAE